MRTHDRKDESFTTWDIQKKLEIKRDRLKEWLALGYIKPSIQQSEGVGTKNLFSRSDLYLIGLLDALIHFQVPRVTAAVAITGVKGLEKVNPEILKDLYYINLIGIQDTDDEMSFEVSFIIKPKSATKPPTPSMNEEEVEKWREKFDYILTVNFMKLRIKIDRLLT
jgi:hypothetical protein